MADGSVQPIAFASITPSKAERNYAQMEREALILSAYNYDLKYITGANDKEADMLSRFPVPGDVIDSNEEIYGLDYYLSLQKK